MLLPDVATCGYNIRMASVGIRQLKNQLSRYVAMTKRGQRVLVTEHGRVVAELIPPSAQHSDALSGYRRLIAERRVTPASEPGDPLEGLELMRTRLPKGAAAALIAEDRDER
jgi:prevent-host-death family protein